MTQRLFFIVLACVLLLSCETKKADPDNFIKVENGRFTLNGEPYYFIGTNFWFGAILGSEGEGGNRDRLIQELDFMKANGIVNLRVLVGADGLDGISAKVEPALQPTAGQYNDTIFDGLDFFLAELGKRNMHAVLFLNNSWEWSGGYSQYLYWSGHGDVPMPNVSGWDVFSKYLGQYAKAEKAQELFEKHIVTVINRTNRYTGKKYCDDPAIMSWQIANEPRPFGEDNKEAFAKWIARAASIIKENDPNHLISIGSEGAAGCEGDIELWSQIHSDPNVDYTTIHIWPNNWSWIDKNDIPGTIDKAIANTKEYIDSHLEETKKMNKPLVMEEFGMPRDGMKFDREASVVYRDKYYQFVFDYVVNHAKDKDVFQGCNFWAWGGFAKPANVFWKKGDDYTGDPAQEEQGLNSVFETDPTIAMIKNNADKIKASIH